MTITIFYSWQSDIKYNRKAILDALRQTITEVENKVSDLHIKINEATSNESGSPHIPNSILLNISKSDIFIGDLSIIGKAYDSEKKLPNPNVLIELGYAVSELGWGRVILLFNKQSGNFPGDLPFDIEKRSCLDFSVLSESDKNGIGQLRTELIARISEIIKRNPPRNVASRSHSEMRQHEQDVETVKSVLNLFRIKRMNYLFKEGYARIDVDVLRKTKEFNEMIESKAFFIFDQSLKEKVLEFKTTVNTLVRHVETDFVRTGGYQSSSYESKAIKNSRKPDRFDETKKILKDVDNSFTSLLDYVRINYHEIDIKAFNEYEDDETE